MEDINHTNSYTPPVDQLLTYGVAQPVLSDAWPDYLSLGLGPEQIPDLIRMATDDALYKADLESLESWAPLHAWRALGQLHAEEAIAPLLTLFETQEDSELVMDHLPEVLAVIGVMSLPQLETYIADRSHSEDARVSAIPAIERIVAHRPEVRPAGVDFLMKQLAHFTENEPQVNEFLILGLVRMKAVEAASLIERAFEAKRVEQSMVGDWKDVQAALGLLSDDEFKQLQAERAVDLPFAPFAGGRTAVSPPDMEHRQRAASQRKTKKQMAKQSRKKNRKR